MLMAVKYCTDICVVRCIQNIMNLKLKAEQSENIYRLVYVWY